MFIATPVPLVDSQFVPVGINAFDWSFPQCEFPSDHPDLDFTYLVGILFSLECNPKLYKFWLIVRHLRVMMTHVKLNYILDNHPEDAIDLVYPVIKLIRLAYLSRRNHRDIFESTQNLLNELLLRWVPSPTCYTPKRKLRIVMSAWDNVVSQLSLQRALLPPGVNEDILHFSSTEVKIPVY